MFGLKRYDILIIILCIAGIILTFFAFHRRGENLILAVYADGKKAVYTLDDADYTIKSPDGWVKIRIRNKRVKVIDSGCPDKWCTRMGWIDNPGESIVCLPSRIYMVIEEKKRDTGKKPGIDAVTK